MLPPARLYITVRQGSLVREEGRTSVLGVDGVTLGKQYFIVILPSIIAYSPLIFSPILSYFLSYSHIFSHNLLITFSISQALNKLMGREIYTTNDQLGGPMIMFPNGVSHLLADTHYDSVMKALEWLSFVPAKKNGPLSLRDISGYDSVDRSVDFAPPKGLTYDPRLLFNGVTMGGKDDSTWQSGFFDKGSFVEALGGWAKTVVMGRGRLGGIPMGVIVTENRTAEALKPADPADLSSQEKMVQQAGGVWFPDSAYKTAQALRDFNIEGLPCIIFANWRGFSGGQRDMFDEVLKFGSMIVDALVAYQQPLFVYIPPFAELRGGAWVVVDSTINADVMEFYAAEVRVPFLFFVSSFLLDICFSFIPFQLLHPPLLNHRSPPPARHTFIHAHTHSHMHTHMHTFSNSLSLSLPLRMREAVCSNLQVPPASSSETETSC